MRRRLGRRHSTSDISSLFPGTDSAERAAPGPGMRISVMKKGEWSRRKG